ncbi:hypothetical protein [Massilia sp. GCM10023247]|uniref:hypothetical protein n=1 Tax=Massilia sp. GCM10023247 TaxID=3252643 RepID=UPI003610CBED
MTGDPQAGKERGYDRRDQRMSKLVYKSQIVRDVFGVRLAHVFMHLMKVDAGVARRVLGAPRNKMRR